MSPIARLDTFAQFGFSKVHRTSPRRFCRSPQNSRFPAPLRQSSAFVRFLPPSISLQTEYNLRDRVGDLRVPNVAVIPNVFVGKQVVCLACGEFVIAVCRKQPPVGASFVSENMQHPVSTNAAIWVPRSAFRSWTDVPWVATLATAAFAILFLLIGDPIWLVAAANFTYLIGICLPNIAVWLLRRDAPEAQRPWRAPRGTIGLGVGAAVIWLLSTMLGFEQFGLPTVVFGLAMAYSGAALFAWRRIEDRVGSGLSPLAPTLHLSLTGAMLLVLSLDAAGYLLAIDWIPAGSAPA